MMEDQSEMIYHMPFLEEAASQASFILELGAGHGNGSTRAFIRGLTRSKYSKVGMVSVDIDPDKPTDRPTVPWWEGVTGSTTDLNTFMKVEECMEDLSYSPPDIIFIDTEHTYDQMKQELEIWYPLSRVYTTWLFHDTNMFGCYNHMTDAIKEFADQHGMVYDDVSLESHGLGRMRKL